MPSLYDEKTEKPLQPKQLPCCCRLVCASCLSQNPRLSSYCPYCQVSTAPSSLPPGLRDPPAYTFSQHQELGLDLEDEKPPAYSNDNNVVVASQKQTQNEPAPDVLHFVDPANDTVGSLSLRYGVPADALRRTNKLHADHLIAARRTVLIPGEHYKGGVSLSPKPIEGEEEELRKSKIRKFMVTCKVSEYVPF